MRNFRSKLSIKGAASCFAASLLSVVSTVPANAQAPKFEATQVQPSTPTPPNAPAQPVRTTSASQQNPPSAPRLALASVIVPGEKIVDADFVSSSRYYADWRLACDELLSKSRRNCRLEQELAGNGKWLLSWKLVESAQKKPFFLVQ